MNRTLTNLSWFSVTRQGRSTAGVMRGRAAIVLAAALAIANLLPAAARADTTYSAALQASLTVSGFLDADGAPVSKPAGLTLTSETFSMPDSFTDGEATANVDGTFGVTDGDPVDLDAGDRIEFDGAVSGTTTFPTGSSFAAFAGFGNLLVNNASSDPVTISFDIGYDYAVSATVDNSALEYAAALAGFGVFTEDLQISASEPVGGAPEGWFLAEGYLSVLYPIAEYNDSRAAMGTASFEVMLSAGQIGTISISSFVAGDPISEVPEPTTWLLGALSAVMLWGAGHRRRSTDG